KHLQIIGPIAHKQACFDHLTVGTTSRYPVARRQRDKLAATAGEEPVRGNEQGISPVAYDRGEGRVDFAAGAGVEGLNLQSDGACRFRYLAQHDLGDRSIGRIEQHRDTNCLGDSWCSSPSRLATTSLTK